MKRRARRALGIRLQPSELTPAATGGPGRFLGRLDPADLRRELEEAGVLSALAARGYFNPAIRVEVEAGEHRLVVAPAGGGENLVELRMQEGAIEVTEPALRAAGVELLSVLAVHWLALQDPHATFTPDWPRLPGQLHPGLGLGRHLYTRVIRWAESLGKDALVNVPAYFHNAKFYAPPFAFLAAAEQGRFDALCRDLAHLPVAEASWAVEEGRVVDARTGKAMAWEPGDMVAALSAPLREYVASEEYARVRRQALDTYRFRLLPQGGNVTDPPDGSEIPP